MVLTEVRRGADTEREDRRRRRSAIARRGYLTGMRALERLLVPLALTAVAAYFSPGLAAFCGASLLVIWGLVELVGYCGSRFYGERRP